MVLRRGRIVRLCAVAAALILSAASTSAAVEYFVPVVAQAPGSGSSYWNTELWISNLSAGPGSYGLVFLPAGTDNTERLLKQTEPSPIGPGQTLYLKDVVPPEGSGALRITASDGIEVRCRLFNVQGRGSVGQMVPALRREELIAVGSSAHLVPLLRSPQHRTNVGIFNPTTKLLKVRVALFDAAGNEAGRASYSVEPGSQMQINDFLLGFKVLRSDGHRAVLQADGPFAAYASVVDTHTAAPAYITPLVR